MYRSSPRFFAVALKVFLHVSMSQGSWARSTAKRQYLRKKSFPSRSAPTRTNDSLNSSLVVVLTRLWNLARKGVVSFDSSVPSDAGVSSGFFSDPARTLGGLARVPG